MTTASLANQENLDLLRIGEARSPLVISMNTFQGKRYLDIRRHYFDEASKSTKPGPKGISLKEDEFGPLMNFLMERSADIEKLFFSNLASDEISIRGARREKAARVDMKNHPISKEFEYSSWAGPNFFNYIDSSNSIKIVFNLRNNLIEKVKNNELNSEDLLVAIMSSYLKAKADLDFGKKVDPEAALDYLEVNWGSGLR